MKITKLNEGKERLPISYITTFISKGWDEIGTFKEEIEAVKNEYSEAHEVTECIESLIDTYLVCLGRMEALLEDKEYIEIPSQSEVDQEQDNKLELLDTEAEITERETEDKETTDAMVEPTAVTEEEPIFIERSPKFNTKKAPEAFEFYCDFD